VSIRIEGETQVPKLAAVKVKPIPARLDATPRAADTRDMLQENVDWIRQFGDAWSRGDLEAVVAIVQDQLVKGHLAADFEFEPLYFDRVYTGVEGMRELWADSIEAWEDYHAEFDEIVDLDDHMLALAHVTGRGAAGGVPIDERIAILFRFQGDKLVWAKSFAAKEEALEASGAPGAGHNRGGVRRGAGEEP
jgi:ketosteroid isomerase-like protein